MLICFFSAYVTEDDEFVCDIRTICITYIKSWWFVADLLGSFPSDLITLLRGGDE